MKVEIWVTHKYAGYQLTHSKVFDMPAPPTLGMSILDQVDDHENEIFLENVERSCSTRIHYEARSHTYVVDVSIQWRNSSGFGESTIDTIIEIFSLTNWKQQFVQAEIDAIKSLFNS